MKHTKEYCIALMEKILVDLKRQRGEEYYDKNEPFRASFYENDESLFDGSIIKKFSFVALMTITVRKKLRGTSV